MKNDLSRRLVATAVGCTAFSVPSFAWLAETNIWATLSGLPDWNHVTYLQVWGPVLAFGIAAGALGFGVYRLGPRSIIAAGVAYCAVLSAIAFWYLVLNPWSEWRW